ncbi:DNA polymerase delta small subunit [Plasmodium gonderi]|uniref:DNA polymerase delta small subunit n=1 Tax=Plasmodium gonderi TaxID=77519 RepID=A0A1Y1JDY1_PLAGO|nr:DNA polymerase delta small subunit [Plasmodium gonderi]GAW80739.1 DNA polymerase delta small subunit [Plasmodium gonderi]
MKEESAKRANQNDSDQYCEFPLHKKIKKEHHNYENLSKDFVMSKATYTQQFCEIYSARIKAMKSLLMKTVKKLIEDGSSSNSCKVKYEGKNVDEVEVDTKKEKEYKLLQYLKEIKTNESCYCIGTLFKKMELRPSILNEYISEINESDDIVINYSHDEDILFLEDETARLKLEGKINSDYYVTGLTVIIKGTGMSNGSLYVDELIYSYIPKLEIPKCITNDDKYIMFVSGLYISENNENNENGNKASLLKDFILGLYGDKHLSENIIRLIIIGNSLRNVDNDEKDMNTIDLFLASLCSSVYVDIMPGEKDPSDAILPQQPFPNLFFKTAKNYNSFQCVTNPYIFSVNNVNICCMSGEPVNNIVSYSKNSKLDALKIIAQSRILSPTSPDTLGCYPFIQNDPFCLQNDDKYPHIFVSGNSTQLEVQYMNEEKKLPMLVCLPSFDHSPKALLVNIKNMEHTTLSFDI